LKNWAGDVAGLADASAAETLLTVPFKNIQLEAVFEKAP
jgi:hypothetical protein